MTSNFQVVEAK